MTNFFYPHGPGVVVPHPPESAGRRVLYRDWYDKRAWCEEQGWIQGEDYLLPGDMVNARWWFKTEKQQMMFILKWS